MFRYFVKVELRACVMAALAASLEGTGLNPMSFTDQHGSVGE